VVRALAPDGRRPEAPISVREQSGRVQEATQENEDVRFCDLGILPVTVTVGSDSQCGQVTVHDVQVFLTETHLLTVTYDPDACRERILPPGPACAVLLRVADSAGRWIAGASIQTSNPAPATRTADQFGRALFGLKLGNTLHATVTASGFRPREITWACPDQDQHEEIVKLTKQ